MPPYESYVGFSRTSYFLPALFFAAHRAFITSESFLRPAAVNPPLWLCLPCCELGLLVSACLRFMASEILFLASGLIVLLLSDAGLPAALAVVVGEECELS